MAANPYASMEFVKVRARFRTACGEDQREGILRTHDRVSVVCIGIEAIKVSEILSIEPVQAATRNLTTVEQKAPPKSKRQKRNNVIPEWDAITKQIRSRDGHQCRICCKPDRATRLHVHHIDGDRANNESSNLVLLCAHCHKSVHDSNYRPDQEDDYPPPWGEHPGV